MTRRVHQCLTAVPSSPSLSWYRHSQSLIVHYLHNTAKLLVLWQEPGPQSYRVSGNVLISHESVATVCPLHYQVVGHRALHCHRSGTKLFVVCLAVDGAACKGLNRFPQKMFAEKCCGHEFTFFTPPQNFHWKLRIIIHQNSFVKFVKNNKNEYDILLRVSNSTDGKSILLKASHFYWGQADSTEGKSIVMRVS